MPVEAPWRQLWHDGSSGRRAMRSKADGVKRDGDQEAESGTATGRRHGGADGVGCDRDAELGTAIGRWRGGAGGVGCNREAKLRTATW
jgi:hypothetical protein